MTNEKYKYSELTGKIIGCALAFAREFEMPIHYKDIPNGLRRVDFFVEDKIMVELKAVIHLEDVQLAQAINYLEAYNMEIGLLVNFGSRSLEFKRVMKPGKKIE
jgi:GxxExxY protein